MVNNTEQKQMTQATIAKQGKELSMSPSAVRSRAAREAKKLLNDTKATVAAPKATTSKPKMRKQPTAAPIKVSAAQKRTIGQFVAALASGFLPIASFVIAHHEAGQQPMLWLLVAAALAFSAPSVASWAKKWCGHEVKAWGFTILLEGVLVFAHHEALSIAGLAMLVMINAANAWSLAAKKVVE
jgi:VIT1/CCC1 family predicted Fe2+/Mn2+ transporter